MIREKIILKEIKNKDVLDIGSIGQSKAYSLWNLYKNSKFKSLTGIDLPRSAEISQKKFLDDIRIIKGNMEYYQFNKKFDIVIAGDVIEHVNNQGLFLNNIYNHLNDDGKLIITTPNAKWPTVFLKPNPTHTLWHDRYTLMRILKNSGFQIIYFKYYFGNKINYSFIVKPLIIRQAIIVICKKIIKNE
jgi:2-polyprenyl-3-methyl-5-hydroxy-6-metoxy-1,4-benzoquinol methylase